MGARIKGLRERLITLAHQTEAMARQGKLKPLPHYLKQQKRAARTGGAAMVGMLEGMAAQGVNVKIKRLKKTD